MYEWTNQTAHLKDGHCLCIRFFCKHLLLTLQVTSEGKIVTLGSLLNLSLQKNDKLAHLQEGITDLSLSGVNMSDLGKWLEGGISREIMNKFLSYCRYCTDIPKQPSLAVQEVKLIICEFIYLCWFCTHTYPSWRPYCHLSPRQYCRNCYDQDQVSAGANGETY